MKTIVITIETPDDIPSSLLRALEAKVHDRILANGGSCGEVHAEEDSRPTKRLPVIDMHWPAHPGEVTA